MVPDQLLCSTSEYLEFGKTQGLQLAAFHLAYPACKVPASFGGKKINEPKPHKNSLWSELCFCLLISQDTVKLKPFSLSVTVKAMSV